MKVSLVSEIIFIHLWRQLVHEGGLFWPPAEIATIDDDDDDDDDDDNDDDDDDDDSAAADDDDDDEEDSEM